MSEKGSKKRKRDEESEEEVELELKRKKKKNKSDKPTEKENNEQGKGAEEVADTDVEPARKKKSKKSKKDDNTEEEDSGKEKKQKKKHRKEKSKNKESDPDQETVEGANNNDSSEKKKRKKKKKSTEAVEVSEDVPAESAEKKKKKKKKKKSKAKDDEESSASDKNAKNDTADEMSDTNIASKRGKYSTAENDLLEQKLLEVIAANRWEKAEGLEIICNGKLKERKGIWIEIASVLSEREWRSVASHCRRRFNPNHYKGKWTDDEEVHLRALVQQHKNAWRLIGSELGRLPTACRDKWREIKHEEGYLSGSWRAEEDEKLLNALKAMYKGQLPNDESPPILWSVITEAVGTRNQDACRARWRKLDPTKQKSVAEWSDEDSKKLVVKVHNMYPQDESEITFSQISKKWAYQVILFRWRVLLKHAKDYQNKSLAENIKALVKHFELTKKDIKNITAQIEEEGW